ncbi:MAG: UPF0280 family protein [Pseudomonadota bacterium]
MTWEPATVVRLPDGRLHLHHGPIDIVARAFGPGAAEAEARAEARFVTVLEELAAELDVLRQPLGVLLHGEIAQTMMAACLPHRDCCVTPMAAVAGAVADIVLGAMMGPGLTRVYVNNGGDVAFWLAPGERMTAALAIPGGALATIVHTDPVRGVATSGWRGRSHSLGIADAVTVLARTAAEADVAATLIANAVDLPGHPAIERVPARQLSPDSDLGDRPVTVSVGPLDAAAEASALAAGLATAMSMRARGLISAAALALGSERRLLGLPLTDVLTQGNPVNG